MCRLVPQRFDVCSIKGVIGVSDERMRMCMCMRVNRGYCLTLYDVVCSTLLLRVRDASTEDWICYTYTGTDYHHHHRRRRRRRHYHVHRISKMPTSVFRIYLS